MMIRKWARTPSILIMAYLLSSTISMAAEEKPRIDYTLRWGTWELGFNIAKPKFSLKAWAPGIYLRGSAGRIYEKMAAGTPSFIPTLTPPDAKLSDLGRDHGLEIKIVNEKEPLIFGVGKEKTLVVLFLKTLGSPASLGSSSTLENRLGVFSLDIPFDKIKRIAVSGGF